MKNMEIQLSIPSRLGFEKIAMRTAESLGEMCGLPNARLCDLRTALSEACINAIEHGNRFAKSKDVEIRMRIKKDTLEIDVLDGGKGVVKHPVAPNLQQKLLGLEAARGWGIFLIENLVDDVKYFQDRQKRNVMQLSVNLPSKVHL